MCTDKWDVCLSMVVNDLLILKLLSERTAQKYRDVSIV